MAEERGVVADFRKALMLFTEETPFALALMKKHLEEGKYSLEELLQAIFVRYFKCRTVLPY